MRAVRFHGYGDFDVLHVEEIEAPVPAAGELLLGVRAAGINPIDWKVLHGALSGGQPLAEARGLGVDVAGIVEQVGPGVAGYSPGDQVLGMSSSPAYAELALSRPEMLLPRPAAVPWEVAGSLGVVIGTAFATLARLAVVPGETLLIAGASGAVGAAATQLAVARGVRVIGTSGPSKLGQVEALGATAVAYGDGLAERLRTAAPAGVDAALDASGHGELAAAVDLAGGAGRVTTIASSAEAQAQGVVFHAGGGGELTSQALSEVLPLIESGRFVFTVAAVYDLDGVGDALRESEHGRPAGKLVIVP